MYGDRALDAGAALSVLVEHLGVADLRVGIVVADPDVRMRVSTFGRRLREIVHPVGEA